MVDIISVACPSCGARVKRTDDFERVQCEYCGNELFVDWSNGNISLVKFERSLRDMKSGVDKTASELAIVRLEKEIKQLSKEIDNIDPEYKEEPVKFIESASFQLLAMFLVLQLAINISDDTGFGTIFGCSSIIILAIVVAYIINRGKHYNYRNNSKHYRELKEKLDQKKQALNRHRDIVAE